MELLRDERKMIPDLGKFQPRGDIGFKSTLFELRCANRVYMEGAILPTGKICLVRRGFGLEIVQS